MISRILGSLVIIFAIAFPAGAQSVVRFETTVGDFDMVLNPTNNVALTGYVNNMLNYVESNRYLGSWINRADTGFVLQMGGFFSNTKRPPPTMNSIRNVNTFAPVVGHPAAEIGLSNTVGTVALALPGDGQGGTNQDAGTSSFFVNLTTNSFLDADFTVFAAISDMTTINNIMALSTIDRTNDPVFDADPGNLAFTDVPVASNGFQVFIKRAFVVTDTMASARAIAAVAPLMSTSAAAFDGSAQSAPLALSSHAVPEPAGVTLLLVGALSALSTRRRRPSAR